MNPLLEINDLHLSYAVRGVGREVLRGISLSIGEGESYGLVGESGCGKSTAAYAAIRFLPRNATITSGSVRLAGRDVLTMGTEELRRLRAESVSMVYQDPSQALNPTIRVGAQLTEAFTVLGKSDSEATERSIAMLAKVQLADPQTVMHRYPHQLSGGMQQRVVIAMALACNPKLLILDEPTTGLDATVEAEVLDLVRTLREEYGTSVLFISHNLAAVRSLCDRVGILYAGKLVEEGGASDVFERPGHPYTAGLLRCLPRSDSQKATHRLISIPGFLPVIGASLPTCVFVDRCHLADDTCRTIVPEWTERDRRRVRCHHADGEVDPPVVSTERSEAADSTRESSRTVLEIRDVSKTFHQRGTSLRALHHISLSLAAGETLGLVGESGSGKTTLAHTILGIQSPDEGGQVLLDGAALPGRIRSRTRQQLGAIQIVFQNPDSALNRRHSVRRIIGRTLRRLSGVRRGELPDQIRSITEAVRLTDRHLSMRPSQLSGGLKQRVAIARAFAGSPRIVVCDEPTSALDVSVQAAILNLLADLQRKQQSAYVFISHDLRVVRYLSDRIAVMYLGQLLELGTAERVFNGPHHPYTEALLSAAPTVDGETATRIRLRGEIPSAAAPPAGCVFHTRCPRRLEGDLCSTTTPPTQETGDGGFIRCHIAVKELGQSQAS